jgi:hypothetical protein
MRSICAIPKPFVTIFKFRKHAEILKPLQEDNHRGIEDLYRVEDGRPKDATNIPVVVTIYPLST